MNNILSNIQTVNTVLGLRDQIAARIGVKDIDKAKTLNAILGINSDVDPNAQSNPAGMRYFGVGVNGVARYTSEEGVVTTSPYIPSALNSELYFQIPIRMIPFAQEINHNLDEYRLREEITHDGVVYVLYWLKALDFETNSTQMYTVDNDNVTSDLESITQPSPSADRNFTADKRIIVSRTGSCQITGREIAEAIEYDYRGYYIDNNGDDFDSEADVPTVDGMVSELGFFTGVEHEIGDRTEAVGVNLAIHHCFSAMDLSSINRVIEPPVNLINGSTILSGTHQ